MQSSSRAPVLSATRRRVSAWITVLPRPLQDLDQAPALRAAERPALDDPDGVAGVRLVALVVGVERRRGADDLLVDAVTPGDVDPHRDRLVGPVGNHDALAHARTAGAVLGLRERLGLRAGTAALAGALAPAAALGRLLLALLDTRGLALLRSALRRRLPGVLRAPAPT